MGHAKKMFDEPIDVCSECGAPLEENDDGEIECSADKPCLRQVIAFERSDEKAEVEVFDAEMRKKIKKMKRDRAACASSEHLAQRAA